MMNDAAAQLAELRIELDHLLEQVTGRSAEDFSCVRSQMDQLRVGIGYLLFDLEATRRENQTLRRLLDEQADDMLDSDFV